MLKSEKINRILALVLVLTLALALSTSAIAVNAVEATSTEVVTEHEHDHDVYGTMSYPSVCPVYGCGSSTGLWSGTNSSCPICGKFCWRYTVRCYNNYHDLGYWYNCPTHG
jgi:hypothetical protein